MRMGQRRIVMLVLAVVLLGGLVWAPAALAAGEANLLGQVQGTGYKYTVALPDATVGLFTFVGAPPTWTLTSRDYPATTDWSGWYSMTTDGDLPLYYGTNLVVVATAAANYNLTAAAAPWSESFSLTPGQTKVVNLKLTVLPTAFNGIVKSYKTGHALKGVKIAVAGKAINTGSKGKWTISSMLLKPGAKYTVTYTKSGYKKVEKSYSSLPNATRNVGTVRMKLS